MTVLLGLVTVALLVVLVAVQRWSRAMDRLTRAIGRQVGVPDLEKAIEAGQRELPRWVKAIEFAVYPVVGAMWLFSGKAGRRKLIAGGLSTATRTAYALGHLRSYDAGRVVDATRAWAGLQPLIVWG